MSEGINWIIEVIWAKKNKPSCGGGPWNMVTQQILVGTAVDISGAMPMALDWTDVASSSGWVEAIKR